DDAAVRTVERLVAAVAEGTDTAADLRRRIDLAVEQAEHAAGGAPSTEAQAKLDRARADAVAARALLDEIAKVSDAATSKGKKYLQVETGDASTYIAAAESEIVAGKLADAKKDLDKASKLLRAAGQDPRSLRYSYGVLTDKLAGRAKDTPSR